MATTTNVRARTFEYDTAGLGTQIPFEGINDPGCYVCNWSGHLLRVPEDAVKAGRSPLMTIRGNEPLFVTKISNDPFVALTKARVTAANYDVPVNF